MDTLREMRGACSPERECWRRGSRKVRITRALLVVCGLLVVLVLPGALPAADPSVVSIDVRVAASSDDAEDRLASGAVKLKSSDLELGEDKGRPQLVGLRFAGLSIPRGASITSAHLQFQVDEVNTGTTDLTIAGEASDDALTFTSSSGNITSRTTTAASVTWSPPPWATKGEAGAAQQTPDIATVIQEIVNRPGWQSGNSLVLIIAGTGERTAESFDGDATGAPLLHIEYVAP